MDDLSIKINKEIKNSELYKKYSLLKGKINDDVELIKLREEMESLKLKVCKSKCAEAVNHYYDVENMYKSNPVVKEFLAIKEELHTLLKEIVDILSLN